MTRCIPIQIINYYWGDQIEKAVWMGHVARMRERRGAYTVLVGQFEGKRPFGRSSRR
jgi:hypothetical protein